MLVFLLFLYWVWSHYNITAFGWGAYNYYTYRNISKKPNNKGPQCGIISPLVWSLVMYEVLANLVEKDIVCQGYADDIIFIAKRQTWIESSRNYWMKSLVIPSHSKEERNFQNKRIFYS